MLVKRGRARLHAGRHVGHLPSACQLDAGSGTVSRGGLLIQASVAVRRLMTASRREHGRGRVTTILSGVVVELRAERSLQRRLTVASAQAPEHCNVEDTEDVNGTEDRLVVPGEPARQIDIEICRTIIRVSGSNRRKWAAHPIE